MRGLSSRTPLAFAIVADRVLPDLIAAAQASWLSRRPDQPNAAQALEALGQGSRASDEGAELEKKFSNMSHRECHPLGGRADPASACPTSAGRDWNRSADRPVGTNHPMERMEGEVLVQGERSQACAAHPLQSDQVVRVAGRHGLTLLVENMSNRLGHKDESQHRPLSLILLLAVALAFSAVRLMREYQRAVVFTWSRFSGAKGPGLILLVPYVQQMVRIDLRTIVLDVPSQDVISRDTSR